MPHSSGGGSHSGGSSSGGSYSHSSGGGSHSGGYSSGSSSRSGGYSSGSSTPSASFHKRPQPGAARYVYYDHRHNPHSVYVTGKVTKPDVSTCVIAVLIVLVVTYGIAYLAWDLSSFVPRKTNTARYNAGIVLEDQTGLITEDAALREAMQAMLDKTGVSPAVEVVYESAWKNYYTDLETFALNEYLRYFDDEYHWLFVVSYPENWSETGFVDWQWQGMIGDLVSGTIDDTTEETCTKIMQKYLIRSEAGEITPALTSAFREFSEIIMNSRISTLGIIIAAGIVVLGLLFCYSMVADDIRSARIMRKGTRVGANAKTFNCEYCGSAIIEGSVSNCPRCGAPARRKSIGSAETNRRRRR